MAFVITYLIDSDSADEVIEAIRVEQTIEFPYKLVPKWIQDEIVGKVEFREKVSDKKTKVKISYNEGVVGGEITQFLNLLFGNISLFQGVKIIDIEFPQSFLSGVKGPRFGISGLRKLLNIEKRPMLMTALKPMGMSSKDLAAMATILVQGGIDIIKDDHSLANQPWALWKDRVEQVAAAINTANSKFNRRAIYAPSLNRPTEEFFDGARFAKQVGCGALLLLPGICGYDAMRAISDDDSVAIPVIGHPALLGTFVMNPNHGLSHAITFGTLMRLSGADISIFPNHGGRFSFTREECKSVVTASVASLGKLKSASPALAGGMKIERAPEMVREFGEDITILIGGALHDGDLLSNSLRLRNIVETL
jgi:ribulose-bisphosphate carboxylase large chain